MSVSNQHQAEQPKPETERMVLNELRETLAEYVNNLGKNESGGFLELRLFRAIVAAASWQGFEQRYEDLSDGDTMIASQIATNMLAFMRVANDDNAMEAKEFGQWRLPSVIEGPLKRCI